MTLISCSAWFSPPTPLKELTEIRSSLTGNFRDETPKMRRIGSKFETEGAFVQAVRFDLQEGFELAGALWTPSTPESVGFIVAHGHYGQGKSSAEVQEIAHRLAARGAWVLAVDSPGVEETDVPGRRLHFSEGVHNRGLLVAGGSSALSLQLDGLRRGVDVLTELGVERVGVTGASGGAVAAYYLAWLDDRVSAPAMASPPPIPREAAASGCACDHIPGHPGPDPGVLGQLQQPSLWMADVDQPRPEGLAATATFEVFAGPHSYTEPMQRRALDWFEEQLSLPAGPWLETVPNFDLSASPLGPHAKSIADLELPGVEAWTPNPTEGEVASIDCKGEGPVVIVLGRSAPEELQAAGFRACVLEMPSPPGTTWNESAWTESIGSGTVRADAIAGAVRSMARRHDAVGIWAHRCWGIVASAAGLPFVVEDPVQTLADIDPAMDPGWVHVPGAWNGAVTNQLGSALAMGDDTSVLLAALRTIQP
jgi:dienelactone hydrolase